MAAIRRYCAMKRPVINLGSLVNVFYELSNPDYAIDEKSRLHGKQLLYKASLYYTLDSGTAKFHHSPSGIELCTRLGDAHSLHHVTLSGREWTLDFVFRLNSRAPKASWNYSLKGNRENFDEDWISLMLSIAY